MSPRMPMPQRPKSPARQIAELERHRRREERRLDDATSGRTGDSVVGSSSVQSFDISSPGSDGFTITLPGAASLPWQCTLAVRTVPGVTSGVTLRPRMSSVLGVPITCDGTNSMSASDFATFYGGDEITCDAVLAGTTGGPFTVAVDFSAIRLS